MYFLSVKSTRASGGNNVKNVYEIRVDGVLIVRQMMYTSQLYNTHTQKKINYH